MSTKVVYQLDDKGYLVGEALAHESPLEAGVYHLPAGTVETPPPALSSNQAARWDGASWHTVPDHRGEAWFDTQGEAVEILDYGDPEALGLTRSFTPPPPTTDELLQELGTIRKLVEAQGVPITLASGEQDEVDSDDKAQAKLLSILTQIDKGLRPDPSTFKFKSNVSRKITNADMLRIVQAVLAHVQACFEAEGDVQRQIRSGVLDTKEALKPAFDFALKHETG
ncbi:DUF4376 domain-containing protein [Pseudovibrio exalbescens]|uniref:DUF4376 domain-containing protein n=1 Tax=Pseudovibrio exalbescens TaxID=197461 RepID=UPI002366473A|nr:DUF4376 domain-containing protein [Pseudovibrio exalbescens]MDD7908651.1 DUF4376 domain-containing protein [Pseudovibrio exalbescens]